LKSLALLLIAALVMAACAPVAPMAPTAPAAPTEAVAEEAAADSAGMDTAEADADPGTIVDIAIAAGNFTTLVTAVSEAGLVETLQSEGPFTVFAPTDEAFAALPAGTIEALLADPQGALTDILLYHVVGGKVMSTDLSDGMMADTAQGSPIMISLADGMVKVNDAQVIVADIEASNGVIHVIDAVILPPGDEEAAAESEALGTIAEVAAAAGGFSTLLTAVTEAGLVDALSSEGPFTVFAPTDEAFAALPAGTIEALLADPQGALTDILLYHVVSGKVMSGDLSDGMTAPTLQSASITISIADGVVKVNDATVVVADIEASNGVIHVIDAVILPPSE